MSVSSKSGEENETKRERWETDGDRPSVHYLLRRST